MWGPHEDGTCGDHIRMAVVGPHAMAVLRAHMQWQFLGPHAMVVQEHKCYAICRDHIRLSVLGTTCDYITWTHMRGQLWGPYTNRSSGKYVQSRFWGHQVILLLGNTQMSVLAITCDFDSGNNVVYWCKSEVTFIWR